MERESLQDNQAAKSICAGEEACGCGAERTAGGAATPLAGFSNTILWAFGLTVAAVVLIVAAAEQLGLLEKLTGVVPWPAWLAVVLAGGWPIFRGVFRAARRRKVTSHTLMTVGLVAAIFAGTWPAAAVIVFFMRLAERV